MLTFKNGPVRLRRQEASNAAKENMYEPSAYRGRFFSVRTLFQIHPERNRG